MAWQADRVSALLRELDPLQEKVVRLRYGLGCQRQHSATEIARALEISAEGIAVILREALDRLAQVGLTPRQLRAAASGSQELGEDLNSSKHNRAWSCRASSQF